jgi:hypothetical protein
VRGQSQGKGWWGQLVMRVADGRASKGGEATKKKKKKKGERKDKNVRDAVS